MRCTLATRLARAAAPIAATIAFPIAAAGLTADVVFQGFCFGPISTGNLSNPLAIAIQ